MHILSSPGVSWHSVHENAVYVDDHLEAQIHAGQVLLAGAQAQEQAVAAQLRVAQLPRRRGTPVHVNLSADGSPGAKELSRLKLLSVRLRESLYSSQGRLGARGTQQQQPPRSAPQNEATTPSRSLQTVTAPGGVRAASSITEERIKALELSLEEEQRRSRRLQGKLDRLCASPRQQQEQEQQHQEEKDGNTGGLRVQRLSAHRSATAAAGGIRAPTRESGFALRGFRDRLRWLEEENRMLRRGLSPG